MALKERYVDFFHKETSVYVSLFSGTNGILRDNSKNFETGHSGSGLFKKNSGRDNLKIFRDGTFGIGTIKKFVPQVSRERLLFVIS